MKLRAAGSPGVVSTAVSSHRQENGVSGRFNRSKDHFPPTFPPSPKGSLSQEEKAEHHPPPPR